MQTRQIAGRVYNFGYCIGRNATAGPGFSQCSDFCLGSGGSLYVVNRGTEYNPSQGITKLTLNHEFIWDLRGHTFGDGRSRWPCSIDVDSNENVYVSDDYTHELYIYDKDGSYLGCWDTKGSGDRELNAPSGIAFNKEDHLYVVDTLNHRIQKFTKDGKFLLMWGSQGTGEGEFNMPWGIAVDKEGDVYVADWKNDRVQKFSNDGRYLATFGSPGSGDGELHRPSGVAIDSDGDVYVADCGNDRLNIYAPDGVFITAFHGDAELLSAWAQEGVNASPDTTKARLRADPKVEWTFRRPVAVNVDDEGRIIVLDQKRSRLLIYIKERNFVPAAFNL